MLIKSRHGITASLPLTRSCTASRGQLLPSSTPSPGVSTAHTVSCREGIQAIKVKGQRCRRVGHTHTHTHTRARAHGLSFPFSAHTRTWLKRAQPLGELGSFQASICELIAPGLCWVVVFVCPYTQIIVVVKLIRGMEDGTPALLSRPLSSRTLPTPPLAFPASMHHAQHPLALLTSGVPSLPSTVSYLAL